MDVGKGAVGTRPRRAGGGLEPDAMSSFACYGRAEEPAHRLAAAVSGESEAAPENDPGYAASAIQAMLDELDWTCSPPEI